jgi:hypothetical protein
MVKKNLSITDLKNQLDQHERALSSLASTREKLLKHLNQVEAEMAAIQGTGSPRRGRPPLSTRGRPAANERPLESTQKRAKNEMTLPDALAAAMEVRAVVSPKEAAQFVRANGYKTTSKTFGIQVAGTLSKDDRFKRVGRGQYERVK